MKRTKLKLIKKSIKINDFKIGFLGPKGSFSHQATYSVFKTKNLIPFDTISYIFENIQRNKIDLGVVPAENTLGGIVSETINNLITYSLKVTGSFDYPIHHFLLSYGNDINKIKVIKTHPQAIEQCRLFLNRIFKGKKIKFETASSTTAPILSSKSKKIGFIASKIASSIYNLNILAKNIEDKKYNFTKFYILSKKMIDDIIKSLDSKKTLVLLGVYDRIGILRDILDVIANKNINISSLHSIPSRIKPWDYFFFLELELNYNSKKLYFCLKKIKKYCTMIRILGAS